MENDFFNSNNLFASLEKTPKPLQSPPQSASLLGDLESLIAVLEKPQDGVDIPILKSFATEEDLLKSLADDIPLLSDIVAIELEQTTKYDVSAMIQQVQDAMPAASNAKQGDLSWSQTEQILRKKAGVFIQDLVDEMIPQIENTLRKKLQTEFDALLAASKKSRKLGL